MQLFCDFKDSPPLVTLLCLCPLQANRSRDLGATVYCVGVKDFNETQVREQPWEPAQLLLSITEASEGSSEPFQPPPSKHPLVPARVLPEHRPSIRSLS